MTKELTDSLTFRHGAQVSNRIVQPPMLTNSGANDGYVTQETVDYYAARSQSAGMVVVEYNYVSYAGGPSRSWANDREQLGFYNDSYLAGASQLAEVLKKDGNKAILQLSHTGREANWRVQQGEKVYAPSSFDFGFIDYEVEEMTEADIQAVIQDFADAAVRAVKAGFDGIEIHGANHYLFQQFFSSWSNRRQDQWGGSLTNRMRFSQEVLRAVFKALEGVAPDDFIIGYRVSPQEIHGDRVGYTYRECQELVKVLTQEFELDYIHLSLLQYDAKPEGEDQTFAELIGQVLPAEVKLIIVGNVKSQADAQDALNYSDLVAVGRGTIIDPQFGLKIAQGRGQDIIQEISPDQVKASKLPGGLIHLFSDPDMALKLPGRESIYHLHEHYH
ncbi:NADH-dependent oxidoreductase [Aerococcus urinaehominis]|uniref:NADH-dependent oxidoreductase n=1 Tax=Aerococcus urinaehominis TaxID=128944 RepID=A0A0X8FJU0_9LACT|nr:NADH-dependent oxidoreductase [Aerococcus urinaehominis]AMB98624.1 NADH-dependent oxidoreductase [Aerococcus urinaehominis]SDL95717.1 2,4-dienoyl-CoA reductase [Aerococcus urinaehominis]